MFINIRFVNIGIFLLLSILASFSELCEVVPKTMLMVMEARATPAAIKLLLKTTRLRRIGVGEAAIFDVLSLFTVLDAFSQPQGTVRSFVRSP